MNCKNCGMELNGTETVCPNCSNPVTPVNPAANNMGNNVAPTAPVMPEQANPAGTSESAPVNQVAPDMTGPTDNNAAPVMTEPAPETAPVMTDMTNNQNNQVMSNTASAPTNQPGVQPQPAPIGTQMTPVNQTADPNLNGQSKQKKNLTTIILLIILLVCGVGAILYFTVFNSGAGSNKPAAGGGAEPTEVSQDKSNKVSYGGYTLTIPNGYTTEENDEMGLMIYGIDLAYSFQVDYTNSYDQYLLAFKEAYPDQAAQMEVTIGNRKYIILQLKDTTGNIMALYITKGSDIATFIGYASNEKFSLLTAADFQDLNTILDSAKQGSSSFAPGDKEDAGKDGIKKYEFNQNMKKYLEKGE